MRGLWKRLPSIAPGKKSFEKDTAQVIAAFRLHRVGVSEGCHLGMQCTIMNPSKNEHKSLFRGMRVIKKGRPFVHVGASRLAEREKNG